MLIISVLILVFFSINLFKAIINRRELLGDIKSLEIEIKSLESRNQELVGLIEYFKTIDFVETEARTKLNLRKPGEKIIIVPPASVTSAVGKNTSNEPVFISAEIKEMNNWQKWWNYFFSIY